MSPLKEEHFSRIRSESIWFLSWAPCICAKEWTSTDKGGTCGDKQEGCPAFACDGDANSRSWCVIAQSTCSADEGWIYCDESTPVDGVIGKIHHLFQRSVRYSKQKLPLSLFLHFANKTWLWEILNASMKRCRHSYIKHPWFLHSYKSRGRSLRSPLTTCIEYFFKIN